jgi:hypothetical protein
MGSDMQVTARCTVETAGQLTGPVPASVGLQVGFYFFIYLFILCGVVSVCLVVGPLAHFPPFQGVTMLGEWHSPQLVRLWEVVCCGGLSRSGTPLKPGWL